MFKSPISILTNQEIDRKEWAAFLKTAKASNPFHAASFFDFFQNDPRQDSLAVAITSEDQIRALVVAAIHKEAGFKSYFSKRAIVYGGVAFNDHEYISKLLEALQERLKGKAIYIEIRNFFSFKDYKDQFKTWDYQPHINIKLDVSKFEAAEDYLASLKYNRRREIKQSIKAGADFVETRNEFEVSKIYKILEELYLERVKLPLPSREFFLNQLNFDCFKVFVVKHKDQVIGGAFTLYLEGKGIYTWYYCGIRDYDKKIFPTHLAVMAVIDFAHKNGLSHVDFMGAGRPDEEYGVRKYKLQFGGELVEDGRYLKILNPLLFSIGKTGIRLLSKLKKQ